jgi:excisionase family DNA binding protein
MDTSYITPLATLPVCAVVLSTPVEHRERPPLTVGEAATYLGTSERHVRRLVAERRVAFIKVGHFVRFQVQDLDRFIAEHRVEPIAGARGAGGRARAAR